MKSLVNLIAFAAISLSISGCGASNDPQQLAKSFQSALDSGDLDAASRLADLSGSPARAHSMFVDAVIKCSGQYRCKVLVGPMDDAYRQRMVEQAQRLGIEAPAAEGLLVIESSSKDGSSSGSFKLPYASVDGAYRIASGRHSASQLASLRARTNEDLLQEMFAKGIADPATGTSRKDWATAATRLPQDGGAAGRSLVARTTAMHEAVQANDPDAALRAGNRLDAMLFGKADYEGKPISLLDRQRKMYSASLTNLHDVKVVEGYSLDGLFVLVIEARDGIGWTVRGPILMLEDGDGWQVAGHNFVEYPTGS